MPKNELKRYESNLPDWFEIRNIPQEAAIVISQLLYASADNNLISIADAISNSYLFTLNDNSLSLEDSDFLLLLPSYQNTISKRQPINPASYVQIDARSISDWFGPNGQFSKVMPGYETRVEQLQMAGKVANAFNALNHIVIEAGTGIGKTMGYLIPSVIWSINNDTPVVISTNTKNLQEQIYCKDLPLIKSLLNTNIKTALIKGRQNYLCLNRFSNIISHIEEFIGENQFLDIAKVCAWIFKTNSGDLADAPSITRSNPPSPCERLFSTSEECQGRKCRYYNRCFLQHARALSQDADIIITNHSVYFSEPDTKHVALPDHAQVIFDEAHNLEEAATRKFQRDVIYLRLITCLRFIFSKNKKQDSGTIARIKKLFVSDTTIPEELSKIREALFDKLNEIADQTDTIKTSFTQFLRKLVPLIPDNESSVRLSSNIKDSIIWNNANTALMETQDNLFALIDNITKLAEYLERSFSALSDPSIQETYQNEINLILAISQTDNLNKVLSFGNAICNELNNEKTSLSEIYENLEFITKMDDSNFVYWLNLVPTPKYNLVSLHAAPIRVSEFLRNSIFEKKDSVVLCSATMSVAGSTQFINHRIGLDLIDEDRLMSFTTGSPFDYKKQCVVSVPMFLPEQYTVPDNVYNNEFSNFLVNLASITRGRMLVLFTSYKTLNDCSIICEPLLKQLNIRLIKQGGNVSREKATAMFKDQSHQSVLFGTDSFWEGVDLIGDILSCVVIAKLPFDAVNDPIISARTDQVAQETGNAFHNFTIPNAVIKFRQGFGRLIRHKKDRGIVVIADQRIIKKNYGSSFRNSLPVQLTLHKTEKDFFNLAQNFLSTKCNTYPLTQNLLDDSHI